MKPSLALIALLTACSPTDDSTAEERRRPPDASVPTSSATGSVSCYRQNNPTASCALPAVCCFNNYSSAHDGACSTSGSCAWGTIRCDGPEDCAAGQHCCAHATSDPDWGFTGYQLACQSAACSPAPADDELCHRDADCAAGKRCVTAYGNANSLPRSLAVCR